MCRKSSKKNLAIAMKENYGICVVSKSAPNGTNMPSRICVCLIALKWSINHDSVAVYVFNNIRIWGENSAGEIYLK